MHPEAIKKLNTEIREKLIAALAQPSLQETIAQTRAASAEDTGTFEVVISTADVDRSGEVIDQNGWDLTFYKLSPVVLWGHDYYAPPIGVCDEIGVVDGKLIAKGRFAPEAANPFAQQIRRLYDAGMMRTTSVGFMALEMDGNTITKSQLLEFSFVSVPANPMALSLRQIKELGIDSMALSVKGISIKAEPIEGDACTLEDGTAGKLDASLVCIATEPTPAAKAEGDVCTMDDGTEGVMQMQGDQMVCVLKAATPAEGDVCTLEDGTEGVIDATGTCVAKEPEAEPAAETPAPVAAKGAIADELATEEAAEMKWEKLDDFFELINAFIDVYLDEATPADQFPTLLTELAGLVGELAGGTLPDADEEPASTTEASLNTGSVKGHRATAREILSRSAVEIMRTNTATQKDGASTDTTGKRVEGEETPSGAAPKQRSTNSSSDNAILALKAWNTDRSAMREIATILSEALGKSAENFRNARRVSSK